VQPEPGVLLAVLALPFAGAAATPLVYRALGEHTAYFAAAVAAGTLVLLLTQFGTEGSVAFAWVSTTSLEASFALYLDGLAFLIALLASAVGVLIFIYSRGYMHGEPGQMKYYTTLLVFMGAMIGVALAADLIALFVFWELTSVASFLLIGHYQNEERSQYAARKSMLITVAGGLFMLVGFLLLRSAAGGALGAPTFLLAGEGSMLAGARAMRETLAARGLLWPVLILVGIGAAAKSAQVPLHVWLPDAMEAPTPVSAFLHSATMVKAGVYLVGRLRPLLLGEAHGTLPEWTLLFAAMGLLTMTVAAMLAVGATDIKELLAYSTASHLGLIVAGFGFAEALGAETGAFHILNHASFKAALFLVAGIVAHETGTRRIADLGGLYRDLPVTAAVTAVAALSMAGLPPFNGFYSKELLFEAAYETAHHLAPEVGPAVWIYPAVAVLGSVFTFLYSIRFLMLFFGERPGGLDAHRPPYAMLAPAVVLGVVVVAISLLPNRAIDLIAGPAFDAAQGGDAHSFSVAFPTKLKPAVVMSLVTIATGAVLYPFYGRLHRAIRRARAFPYTSPEAYYDASIAGLDRASGLVPRHVQTRQFRTYAGVGMVAVSALALGGYVAAGVALPAVGGVSLAPALLIVLATAAVGAVAVASTPSHVAGVLTLSILGFMVAVFYVLVNAPDLALTQLLVETLVLVLFLLVLNRMPAFYGDVDYRRAAVDALVAGTVGVTVFLTVLLSTSASPRDSIASYFVETAPVPAEHGTLLVDAGGGNNVVNVILVDFRAFDTMGEISVVAMAALAVLTLIGMRERGEFG